MLFKCVGTLVSFLLFTVNVQAQQLDEDPAILEFRVIPAPDPLPVAANKNIFSLPHGDLYGLAGNGSPDADTEPSQPLPLVDFGGAAGGSILGDRNSYFLSFDRQAFLPENASLLPTRLLREQPSLLLSQFLGRFDHRFSETDAIHARYDHALASSGEFTPSALKFEQQSGAIDNAIDISPTTVNETRGQFTAVNVLLPGGTPAYAIESGFQTGRRFYAYEAADKLSHEAGRQELRGGGSFLYNQTSVSFPQGGAGNSSFSDSSRNAGFYFQDQWKVSRHLVLTGGAMYDLQFLRGAHTQANNLGPLLGFAWSPGRSQDTVLRGGYGVTYQQIALPAIFKAWNGDPTSLASITLLDPSIRHAYAEHGHLEFEHQFGERSTFLATYQHVRGLQLAAPSGQRYQSTASSYYDGLTVAFVQHARNWGDYKIAYDYADGTASQGVSWDNAVADQMRRASFIGTLHTPMSAGAGIWEQMTHRISLTGYGDFTRHNELPGVDFVHLDTRLTKEVQISRHTRLELFLQKSGLLQRHSHSIAQALAQSGDGELTMSYAGFAGVNSPSGIQVGLRIRF